MELKFSKNYIGIFVTLLLVILLCQTRFLNFFIDTYFGRFIFVFLILGISYLNKIFGVIGVLFLIIMFNQSDIGYIEGFTDGQLSTNQHINNLKTIKEKKITAIKNKINSTEPTTATTESTNTTTEPTTTESTTTEPTTTTTTEPTTTTTETFSGREGFNIIDREGSILKGKRSNEIPVFNETRKQSEYIEPVDKSVFSNNYSLI